MKEDKSNAPYAFFWEENTLTYGERLSTPLSTESERYLNVAPTFVTCLANGLVLLQASGYQPKTWLSGSLVHCYGQEFSPQANRIERSLSNKLNIHKIEAQQRQQLWVSTPRSSSFLTDQDAAFQTPAWSRPSLLPRSHQQPGGKSIKNSPGGNCGILHKVQQMSGA